MLQSLMQADVIVQNNHQYVPLFSTSITVNYFCKGWTEPAVWKVIKSVILILFQHLNILIFNVDDKPEQASPELKPKGWVGRKTYFPDIPGKFFMSDEYMTTENI